MAWGKPRKSLASREPNGKPQRKPPEGVGATEAQRLRAAALTGLRDAVWGTSLGYLYLADKLTPGQFNAGKRWAELAEEVATALQSPKRPRSVALEQGARGGAVDPDSAQGLREARQHAKAIRTHTDAIAALKRAGKPPLQAVTTVCGEGFMPVGQDDLTALRQGLEILREHWNQK